MMEKMRNRKKKKGFTLIELIVVIAILGILAAIAIPRLSSSRLTAQVSAHNANVRTIESAANMYAADGGTLPLTSAEEPAALYNYLQKWPDVPANIPGSATKYTVGIDATGAITVSPGLMKLNNDKTAIVAQ